MSVARKIFFMIALLFFFPKMVQAQSPTIVHEQLESFGLDEITTFWEEIHQEYGGYLPESQKGNLTDFLTGEKHFSFKIWFTSFLKFLFYELIANGKTLGTFVLLAFLSAILQSIQSAFEKSSISKVADAVIYMVLIIFAMNSFYIATTYTLQAITHMTNFLLALFPILLALTATSGGVISVSFFHPFVIFLMNVSGVFMKSIVMPLLMTSTVLSIASTMSDQYKVTKLAKFLRNGAVGAMGFFLTIFLGILSVQGATTAVSDGVAMKTAKFVTGNFIPVVGKALTDAADTVLGASLLLKNTVGIVGMVLLLLIVAFPAIKILAIAFIYKVAAAILQPLGNQSIIACLDVIGKCVIYVFACLAIVSLMFFLTLTIIIASGNISTMVG